MYYFDLRCAIDFHDDIISEIGGLKGYNKAQIGYLNSALDQIQNDDYYPTFLDKMTHIIFSCVKAIRCTISFTVRRVEENIINILKIPLNNVFNKRIRKVVYVIYKRMVIIKIRRFSIIITLTKVIF